jgi:uncharacterized SAM-binding protein YcdF (DUF218 family)
MKRVLRGMSLLIAGCLVIGLLVFALLAWQVDRLGRTDDARPADAIVVLGARVDADGQPGSDLTSRTLHAVDLFDEGFAPRIICSGGFKNEPLSAASVCRRYAVGLGVPENHIWLADGTSNTAEDATATAAVMAAHGWHSAILVSHPLHLYRARWFFTRTGLTVVTSPTTTATGRIYLPLRVWYAVREAGAIVINELDGWGWLPHAWKAQLEVWRLNLP